MSQSRTKKITIGPHSPQYPLHIPVVLYLLLDFFRAKLVSHAIQRTGCGLVRLSIFYFCHRNGGKSL